MKSFITIEGNADAASVIGESGKIIMDILGSGQDQTTIQVALTTLANISPANVYNTISGSNFVDESRSGEVSNEE